MPRRWARAHDAACSCSECGRLDLEFPGEGRQLALALAESAPPPF